MKFIFSFILLFNLMCFDANLIASQSTAARVDLKSEAASALHKIAEPEADQTSNVLKLKDAIKTGDLRIVKSLVPVVPKDSLKAASMQAQQQCAHYKGDILRQTILRTILNRLYEKPAGAQTASAFIGSNAGQTAAATRPNSAQALAKAIVQLQTASNDEKEMYCKGCLYTRTELVHLIKSNQFDVSQPMDAKKRTILMRAAMKDDIELMALVFNRIKDSKYFKLRDSKGENALTLAIKHSDPETIEFLTKKRIRTRQGDQGTIEIHIYPGVDINERNQNGETALHVAVKNDLLREVAHLLEAGADVDAQDNTGSTALMLSVHTNNPAITAALIQAHANPLIEIGGITALELAQTAMENSNFEGDEAFANVLAQYNNHIIKLLNKYTHTYALKKLGHISAIKLLAKIKRRCSGNLILASASRAAWKKAQKRKRAQEATNQDQKTQARNILKTVKKETLAVED